MIVFLIVVHISIVVACTLSMQPARTAQSEGARHVDPSPQGR
jgi:uncharacterized protein YpmB